MAPLPKRKHSKARKGKRLLERHNEKSLPQLVVCPACGKMKLPHQQCKYCQSTANTAARGSMQKVEAPQKEAPKAKKEAPEKTK